MVIFLFLLVGASRVLSGQSRSSNVHLIRIKGIFRLIRIEKPLLFSKNPPPENSSLTSGTKPPPDSSASSASGTKPPPVSPKPASEFIRICIWQETTIESFTLSRVVWHEPTSFVNVWVVLSGGFRGDVEVPAQRCRIRVGTVISPASGKNPPASIGSSSTSSASSIFALTISVLAVLGPVVVYSLNLSLIRRPARKRRQSFKHSKL
ncbi:hypothetical protein KCV03_g295, partial [Aureobasidium melanogenum]